MADRLKRVGRTVAGIGLGVLVCALFAIGVWWIILVVRQVSDGMQGCAHTEPSDRAFIETAGNEIIAQLEEHKQTHGRFPRRLSDASLSEETPYGPWRYEVDLQGREFTLSFGDYNKCLWEVSYSSQTGTWYHDH